MLNESAMIRLGLYCIFRETRIKFRTTAAAAIIFYPTEPQMMLMDEYRVTYSNGVVVEIEAWTPARCRPTTSGCEKSRWPLRTRCRSESL